MRTNYGGLIGATPSKKENIANPFQGLTKETLASPASAMSLSVYNRPEQLARPSTANVNILSSIPGLEVQELNDEGQPIIKEEKPCKMPNFMVPEGLTLMARTG